MIFRIFSILFFVFLLFGVLIISNNTLYLSKKSDLDSFVLSYSSWISKLSENSQAITANVIKLDWAPR